MANPTISITVDGVLPGSTVNNLTYSVTFTASENITGFVVGDVTVTNGALSAFSGSNSSYTATLTPTAAGNVAIDIAADVADNTAETPEGNLAADTFAFTWAPDPVGIVISSGDVDYRGGTTEDSVGLVITAEGALTGLTADDFTVTNGAVSSLAGSGSAYTATLTPTTAGERVYVQLEAGAANGPGGIGSLESNLFWFTDQGTKPTVTLSSTDLDSGDSGYHDFITIKFVTSVETDTFNLGDITVGNGYASDFVSADRKTYYARIYPASVSTTPSAVTIDVAAGTFSNLLGAPNAAASQFTWTPSVEADIKEFSQVSNGAYFIKASGTGVSEAYRLPTSAEKLRVSLTTAASNTAKIQFAVGNSESARTNALTWRDWGSGSVTGTTTSATIDYPVVFMRVHATGTNAWSIEAAV